MQWSDQDVDALLSKTESLAGSKKDKSCLIFSGSYLAQHVDYEPYLNRPDVDLIGHNLCWLLPGAEKFTYMLHGSRGYTHGYAQECTTFKTFCKRFGGHHLFCMNTKYWAGGPYPIPTKGDTIKAITRNNIDKYHIFTQEYSKQSLAYVAPHTDNYKLSRIPGGCGGTLNAVTIPFALKLGYKRIYVAGIGDQYLHHFYDGHIMFKYNVPPPKKVLSHRDISLNRYRNLVKSARNSGSEIYAMPTKLVEPTIKSIFKTAEKIS